MASWSRRRRRRRWSSWARPRRYLALVLVATFVGGVANLVAIVGFMVTVTTGVPDREQGLATGLATMSQQVGITMGIPIMSAIVTAVVHRTAAAATSC